MKTALYTDAIPGLRTLQWSRKGDSGIVQLFGDDGDDDTRIELIERSMKGEQIELFMRARTYGQGDRFTCRKPIEMSIEGMDLWAERAPGTAFQFDHLYDEPNCGGVCEESEFVHLGGNSYELIEGLVLNTPRAVKGALRRNIRKFSIGIYQRYDTILCGYCKELYYQCGHYAGERIDGAMVRVMYTDPTPTERSSVTFPAVGETGVLGCEQLSALFPSKHETKGTRMELSVLISTLGLDAGADEATVLQAITVLRGERGELSAKVEKLSADLVERDGQVTELSGKLATLQSDKAVAELEGKITALKADARITDAQAGIIRKLFEDGHTESAAKPGGIVREVAQGRTDRAAAEPQGRRRRRQPQAGDR